MSTRIREKGLIFLNGTKRTFQAPEDFCREIEPFEIMLRIFGPLFILAVPWPVLIAPYQILILFK